MRLGRPPEEIYPFAPLQPDFAKIPMPCTVPRMAGSRLPCDGRAAGQSRRRSQSEGKCRRIEGGKRDVYYTLGP